MIVATAGHVDHGKTSLVRALTGTDPDRLKAEKEQLEALWMYQALDLVQPALLTRLLDAKDGHIRALFASYACHCTTLGATPNRICGDWAGYAREYLEADHPGAIALVALP